MNKAYTIKDIAELAGVSKGTVDRVLHRRGKVSNKAQLEVEKILKEIDYQPNPIARNLKTNKVYKISVLLPDPKYDTYWEPAVQGIHDATNKYKGFGLVVDEFFYNPSDRASFLNRSNNALKSKPDFLLMAPLFQKEALEIFIKCQEQGTLLSLFNNYIDAFKTESFIGQDLHQSGRVAASIIDKIVNKNSTVAIVHLDEEQHMKQKENGFKLYFENKTNAPKFRTLSLDTTDKKHLAVEASNFMKKYPNISAIFITNSKSYLFMNAIQELGKEITIVGYDLLKENIEFLRDGTIDFLIHQKPKRQAFLGIENLAEHFLFGKKIQKKKLLPIDIITLENVKYHID